MFQSTLEDIGLSPNEAKIYETLLNAGQSPVSRIAVKSKVHRRNVYDALERLIEKGLVFPIFAKSENMYEAVNPEKLLEVVDEKRKSVQTILPDLSKMYHADPTTDAAYVYKGIEGFKNYMRDLVRVSEDTYFLAAKALWFTPGVPRTFLDDFVATSEKKRLQYFTLYDPRVKHELPQAIEEVRGQYKFLPEGYETPGVVDVFGDYVVTFTSADIGNFGEDGTIFVMINPDLAESYRVWFRLLWDLCPE